MRNSKKEIFTNILMDFDFLYLEKGILILDNDTRKKVNRNYDIKFGLLLLMTIVLVFGLLHIWKRANFTCPEVPTRYLIRNHFFRIV
jgi:hypothetical protein